MKTITLNELLAKATPGPRTLSHCDGGRDVMILGAGGVYVGNVMIQQIPRAMGLYAEPERQANASLLAHAANHIGPLFEAAQQALDAFDRCSASDDNDGSRYGDAAGALRKALAAAKSVEVQS